MRIATLAVAVGLLPGCFLFGGGDSPDDDIYDVYDDSPLHGTVGGQEWAFLEGETDAFLSDDDTFFVSAYREFYDECGGVPPDPPYLILNVPTSTGEYDLSFGLTMTFVPSPGENLIATDGRLRVFDITGSTVSGAIAVAYDDDNGVGGTFEAHRCDDLEDTAF